MEANEIKAGDRVNALFCDFSEKDGTVIEVCGAIVTIKTDDGMVLSTGSCMCKKI